MTRPGDVAESFVAAISRHDPDAVARCFAEDYEDEAPARRGEVVRGRDEVRANFVRMFASMPDVDAAIVRLAEREDEVWIEWRLSGTREDGTTMDFVGSTSSASRTRPFARAASTRSSRGAPGHRGAARAHDRGRGASLI